MLAGSGGLVPRFEQHQLNPMMSQQTDLFSGLGVSDVMGRAKFRAQQHARSFGERPRFPRVVALEPIHTPESVPSRLAQVALATQGLSNSHERYIVRLERGEEALVCFDAAWLNFLAHGVAGLGELGSAGGPWRPQPNLVIASRAFLSQLAPTSWEDRRERDICDFANVSQIRLPEMSQVRWVTGHGDIAEDLVIAAAKFAYRARGIRSRLPYPTRRYQAGHRDGSADFVFKHIGEKVFHIGSVKGSGARPLSSLTYTKADAWEAVCGSVARNPGEQGMAAAFGRRRDNCLSLGVRHPAGGTFDSHARRSVMVMGKRLAVPVREDAVLRGWVYAPQASGEPNYLPTTVPIFPIHFLALED